MLILRDSTAVVIRNAELVEYNAYEVMLARVDSVAS